MEQVQRETNEQLTKAELEQPKFQIKDINALSSDKELLSEKKEDLNNKLSDSACGSLNESEDSGSKCQENESNVDVEEESDSLDCDDKDELDDSGEDEEDEEEEEEESVDNNTFNVINTENSESQEISELTNDDSSHCDKIKDTDSKGPEITGQISESSTETSESSSDNSNSEEQQQTHDNSESNELSKDDEPDTSIGEDPSSKSKKSEEQTETSEDPGMELSTDSTEKKVQKKEEINSKAHHSEEQKNLLQSKPKSSNSAVVQNSKHLETKGSKNSPKIKRRLPPSANNAKNNEFKIEIYESKRKPDMHLLNEKNSSVSNKILVDEKQNNNKLSAQNFKIETELEKNLDSPQNSDRVLSSEPSTSISDVLSPDSVDKTSSIMLDVSQVIKEESEESDALSPIRSFVEDVQSNSSQPVKTDQDTAKKNQSESKNHQNGDSDQKPAQHSTTPNLPSTPPPITNSQKLSPPPTLPVNSTKNVNNVKTESPKTPTTEPKKPNPMAFTVDFESVNSDSSASGNSAKKLNIAASISQWAPKHRRNLSLTKVDEHKKVEERQSEKPPLGRPRSGTVGAGPPGSKRGGAGYHSEGYFSSDQDDEGPKRADLKSPRSPRTPDTVQAQPLLVRSNSQDSSKGNSLRMRPPSPLSSPTSPYGAPLTETASFLIEKMMNATPETRRKFSTKPEGRSCCKERERKPSVSELTGKTYRTDKKMGSDSKKHTKNVPADDFDHSKDDKDDVSETGTYTIDKDSPTPEEDQARHDIDGVFGITTESEAETTTAAPMSTTDQCQEDESSWMSAPEMPPTISRNSPNWIQQWAAHVAEQTKPPIDSLSPMPKPSVTSPRGHKVPMSVTSPRGHKIPMASQENNDSRPRRKLPTPPSHLTTTPSGLSQRSELASSKHRARVDKSKGANPAFRNTSFESHESGGDSDFDTNTSYPFNDDERMSASLKSKLRLTGLMPQAKSITSPSAGITSPRRPDGGASLDSKHKSRDPTYEMHNFRRDERGLQSDSSSEASEPYKDVVRTSDNNPPLKFNRAFSLRRARLGCDDPVSTSSLDKKKANRAASAGTIGSARKGTLGASKSYQNAESPSVSSPRSYGYGSPRGIASPSQNVGGSKGTPQSDNFDRTDGGRYSLRLARSGSSSIGLVKSPSKSNIKKDPSISKKTATRSNSTLSSKEVDFQNWKRRKNYDPMKAAAEGKKKQVEKKGKNTQPSTQGGSENRSPSPPGSLLRSASFHGTEGVMCNVRWTRKPNNIQPHYTSEDDGPYSLEEEIGPHPSPRHGSPLHRSPTSPHQLCQSPSRHPQVRGRRPSLGHSEEDVQYQSSLRKISLDESGSEGKRSPLNSSARGGSGNSTSVVGRPKTKMEALDNLVISTIHSLSVKVRTTSESLLQKLKSQYDEEGDRAALLEEVLSHLSESDQSLTSGQTRSTSRELAGILRNLKKIEHALEVIDRVIIVGEEDYREDDIDYVPTEWVDESDY